MTTDLDSTPRFQQPQERRDFLGLTATWSAGVTVMVALLGALRLPMPWAFPESSRRVKLGPLSQFEGVDITPLPEQRMWIYSGDDGLYAISAVCTHLGCIVSREDEGGFFCPCHGSRFAGDGKVTRGPAPKPLLHLKLSVAPDGQLVVDQDEEVGRDVRLTTKSLLA